MPEMASHGGVNRCTRCRDLLPWYVSGGLTRQEHERVASHLAECAECRGALAEWNSLAAMVIASAEAIVPTVSPEVAWESFSAGLVRTRGRRGFKARLAERAGEGRHAALVVGAQVRLLRRGIWVASALGILLAALYGALLPSAHAGDVLTFALPLIAAAGAAFLCGPENDSALELALGTPTTARTVVFGRFLLLFMYDTALALVATVGVAYAHSENLWQLSSLWFGPMALLSSISLVLSLFVNPFVAGAAAAAMWTLRLLRLERGETLRLAPNLLWHTSPQIIALSLGLLAVALIVAPYRESPVREWS